MNFEHISSFFDFSSTPFNKKGTEVFVPIYALQRDEKYWPDPDKYDPERFNDQNSAGKDQINRPYYPL